MGKFMKNKVLGLTNFNLLTAGEYYVPAQRAHCQITDSGVVNCIIIAKIGQSGQIEQICTISVHDAKDKFHLSFNLKDNNLYTDDHRVGIGKPDKTIPIIASSDAKEQIIKICPDFSECLF